jgi:hypothetical protein
MAFIPPASGPGLAGNGDSHPGRSLWFNLVHGVAAILAIGVTLFVLFAGTGGVDRWSGRRLAIACKVGVVEKAVQQTQGFWVRGKTINYKLGMYTGLMLAAIACLCVACDTAERFVPSVLTPGANLASLFFAALVIGLFSARLRIEIFSHAGPMDWLVNTGCFGIGVAAGLVAHFVRKQ